MSLHSYSVLSFMIHYCILLNICFLKYFKIIKRCFLIRTNYYLFFCEMVYMIHPKYMTWDVFITYRFTSPTQQRFTSPGQNPRGPVISMNQAGRGNDPRPGNRPGFQAQNTGSPLLQQQNRARFSPQGGMGRMGNPQFRGGLGLQRGEHPRGAGSGQVGGQQIRGQTTHQHNPGQQQSSRVSFLYISNILR